MVIGPTRLSRSRSPDGAALRGTTRPRRAGRVAALTSGGLAVALWAWVWAEPLDRASGAIGLIVPGALVVLATGLVVRLLDLHGEVAALRGDVEHLRRTAAKAAAMRTVQAQMSEPSAANVTNAAQGDLPLGEPAAARAQPDLTLEEMLRALDFPRDETDEAGLRTLEKARAHHAIGPVVQSAQDLMTLMARQELFIDDLDMDDADGAAWRACATGTKAEALGVPASPALHALAARLSADAVFRDTAHHFMRRTDGLLVDMAAETPDETLQAFGRTRSGRCFRLVGTALGAFPLTE